MVDYEVPMYEDQFFEDKNDNVSDLHAYYMSQFNLELENSKKDKTSAENFNDSDNFKYGAEESIDFEVLGCWNDETSFRNNSDNLDQVINKSVDEQNIKEVLLDLDSIEFDDKSLKTESDNVGNIEILTETTLYESYNENNEYIDDESLIDELCREDGETAIAPDFNEEYLVPESTSLPSIETVFSKRYNNYSNNNQNDCQNDQYNYSEYTPSPAQTYNIEQFSYPNNILYNLDQGKGYSLPDTPTSCTEFQFDRNERTVSISESIDTVDSDVQSCSYFDDNSENFDDDDLFVNLDDFGLMLEKDNGSDVPNYQHFNNERVPDREKQGERFCLWEHCYERYPNQSALVEHIERAHVNTYKGDEFSCLWRDCTRARRPFNARYKLLIHMRVHSGHKPNRCHHPGCGKAFSRLENLKIHVRSHTGERPYACLAPHCRKAFSNSSDRAKHQRTHFNARPYACGAAGCGKRYTDPSSLRKHIKTHPHIAHVPRTCPPPIRPARRPDMITPSSPAKLTTLRCIRDKLSVTRMQRL